MTYTPLDLVESYLSRFVAYPSEHALVAHVLWIAHTHLIESFDTTPRLAFMSAEKESGKTRALEVTELFVRDSLMAFSATPAVLVRLLAERRRTLLYDEIDSVFGSAKRQEDNGALCAFLNAGYRRGAKAHKCSTGNGKIAPEEYDAFAAVAVAGLRALPDMLASRAVFIRMKRRAPNEQVEPFRHRFHPGEAKPIAEALAEWCEEHDPEIGGAEPEMPEGVVDRAADIWEPLIAIADAAGNDWPARARAAAVFLSSNTRDEAQTMGVELLEHIQEAFGAEDKLPSRTIIDRLCDRDESPWNDIRGKPLDERGLALRLKHYGIRSKVIRIGDKTPRGYDRADFADSWGRYCPAPLDSRNKRNSRNNFDNKNNFVAPVAAVAAGEGEGVAFLCPACDGAGCPTCKPEQFGLPARGAK